MCEQVQELVAKVDEDDEGTDLIDPLATDEMPNHMGRTLENYDLYPQVNMLRQDYHKLWMHYNAILAVIDIMTNTVPQSTTQEPECDLYALGQDYHKLWTHYNAILAVIEIMSG